ncbi:MAG: AraC family transcriptional regulator [Paenibacillus sp.]|nr:AraC family transcriptional regulator [Paenibacillus sp.]
MNIIEQIEPMYTEHKLNTETGSTLVYWTLATIPEIPHWHDALEICYCLSGKGVFYFLDQEYDITAGDLIIVNNVERHTSKSYRGDPCSNLFLFFSASMLEQLDFNLLRPFIFDRKRFTHKIPAHLPVAKQIGALIMQMKDEQQLKQPGYGPLMKSLLLHICSLLLRHYHVETSGVWQNFYAKYATIRTAIDYIHAHFHENIQLDDVAKAMSLSSSRARHLFAEVMGDGFKTYLTHLRIKTAQRLLVQTELSIEDIYEQCGFQSASSFYREFQKLVKETPLSYKKRQCSEPLGRLFDA